jgi:hypothetical protein
MSISIWETSAKGEGAETLPGELSTLGEHKAHCTARSAGWASLQCNAGQALGFMSARLVTVAALVSTVVVLWLVWA